MGFGLLFIGYIFFLYVLPVGPQFLSVGASIMLYALYKLSRYHAGFRRAAYLALLLFFLGLPSLAEILLEASLPISPSASSCITAAAWAALIVFHIFLFGAIADLAKRTSLFRLQVAATQNRLFTAVFCGFLLLNEVLTLLLISRLPEDLGARVILYVFLGKVLFGLLIAGLNLVMLYQAYMRFCPPGAEKRGVDEYESFIASKKTSTSSDKEDKRK